MKLIEDYIRRYFREATSTKEVDAEDLWANIEAGLPPQDEDSSAAGAVFPRYLLGLLVLGMLSIAGYWLWPSGEAAAAETVATTERVVAKPTEAEKGTAETGDQRSSIDQAETTSLDSKDAAGETPPLPAGPLLSSTSAVLLSEVEVPATAPTAGLSQETPSQPSPRGRAIENARRFRGRRLVSTDLAMALAPTATREKIASARDKGAAASVASNQNLAAFDQLQLLPILPLPSKDIELNFPPVTPITYTPQPFRKSSTTGFEFAATTGSNLMLRKYLTSTDENTMSALNGAIKSSFGQSVALEISYGLTDKIHVSSGLEYLRTHNTFRYTIEKDSTVAHPSFPYRDIAAQYIRRVEHNNYQAFLAVPLLLDYRKTFGQFQAGLAAGIALNYQLRASGRTLTSPTEVVAYDSQDASSPLPTPDFFLSYRLRPSLSFAPKANSPWRLLLRTDVQYYRFGASSVSGLSQRALLIGGSVGVRYRFGSL